VTPDGVRDLAGNVSEWVAVDDHPTEAKAAATPASEKPEIFRGGAFSTGFQARSAARALRLGFNVAKNLGFRCAKSALNNH
jgi:formylglycine-generating enzyme required for sulfatase activity